MVQLRRDAIERVHSGVVLIEAAHAVAVHEILWRLHQCGHVRLTGFAVMDQHGNGDPSR